ncbi:hypothetical protein ACHQM5_006754 [Ranunculus cassubicifolius]
MQSRSYEAFLVESTRCKNPLCRNIQGYIPRVLLVESRQSNGICSYIQGFCYVALSKKVLLGSYDLFAVIKSLEF